MKNFLNLNQLSMSWNEKQKPQRFRRYAVMLMMLLTLGVGQMWAWYNFGDNYGSTQVKIWFDNSSTHLQNVKIYFKHPSNDSYSVDYSFTQIAGTDYWEISTNYAGFEKFEIHGRPQNSDNDWGWKTNAKTDEIYSGWYTRCLSPSTTSGQAGSWTVPGLKNVSYTRNSTTTSNTLAGSGTSVSPYVIKPGTAIGVQLSGDLIDNNCTKYYKFGGGSATTTSTKQVVASAVKGTAYSMSAATGAKRDSYESRYASAGTLYFTTAYSISASVSGSHGSVNITSGGNYVYSGNTSFTVTASPDTGYEVDSWSVTGGTKSGSGNAISVTASGTADCSVSVSFKAKTYSITLDDNGDYQGNGSATIQRGDGSLTVSSHASRTGWNLVGYWTGSGSSGSQVTDAAGNLIASVSGYTDGSGNWIYDGNVSLYAHWNQINSLSVVAGSNISSVTGSTSPVTLGNKYDISATPNTGYSFSGWTAVPSANAVFDDATAASTNVTVKNGSVTVTGAATENMTTVTVNVSPAGAGTLTLDASAFTPGNTTTAGVATSHTVVASANSGYTFLGWYRDGNAAGTNSTNTYTLKGNGSSGTGTLTAVFASNATAGWYLIGQPFDNNWGTNNHSYPLNLKYRGMSDVYMRVVDFSGVSNKYFKPLNNSTIYGQSSGSDVAVVTGTQYAITNTSSNGTAFKTNGQSTVWCIVDATNKKFWVQTPADYFPVTLSNGSSGNTLSGTEGTISLKTKNYGELATIYYALNESIKVAITAESGYWIDDISINGSSVATDVNASSWNGWVTMPSTTATLTVTYNRIYSLSYNANGGSGAAPATTYHISGTNATAAAASTFTARAYYTFGGWNTAQYITGTNYAAGASVPMTANTTLYAKWTRSVTLNQEDATTTGSTSVTGTYNCATLPAITNPEKIGYEFGGWYTEVAGGGNIIINTSGALQADKYHWTDASGRFDRTTEKAAADLYAKWTQTVTLNANTDNHGSGSNKTATVIYKKEALSSITHCTPATGYHLVGYYTDATGGTKVLNVDGTFASSAVTDYITDGKWTKADATTLYAHYEPNTYDVILDVNGATSGSNQTVVATFDAAMPTTQKTSGDAITAPSKTGYTFGGYWTNAAGTGTQYYTGGLASSHVWDVATNNTTIYAKWTANPYTVTLDVEEDNHGTIASADVSASVTYDATPSTIANRPTAANGYALDGYYTDQLGEGTKVINGDGTWIASVDGYTDGDAKWVHVGDVTLYAYYKKAEITNLVAAPGVIAPGETITITPTIEPTPTGTTKVCWEVQYSNGTPLPSQPTFTPGVGNAVSFPVPSASATYIIQATLAKGSSCPADPEDVLSTRTTTFQVAGSHTVTVRYQDSDGRTLKDTIHITARPLDWTTLGDITPPTITGYKFDHWDAGDGVTIKNGESTTTTTTTSSIQIKATYDGTLTAVYAKKRMIYFNNTLGWSSVYVYFYKNDSYWQTVSPYNGSGANTSYTWTNTPYSEGKHGQMLPVSEGSNIYYFDAEAAGVNASYDDVVFTEADQHGEGYFHDTKAVRRGDYKTSLPMFVPVDQTPSTHNKTDYYNKGYWMNYPENTGYTLKIYNAWNATKETAAVQSIAFPYSEDLKMPLKMDVELSDGYNHDYWFMVYRNDGTYMGSAYHFKQGYQDEQTITGGENKNKITTSAPGNYTFILTYHGDDSNPKNYNFYIDVDFPIASGDYRIYYSDNATWSKAAHTKDSWYHPSHSIGKATTEAKKDTISFFIPKGVGISHTMKFQKASVTNEGVVTWDDVDGGSITIPSSVNATGVYNFIVSQPAGGSSISLEKVEPYTGNFYIRTDCAGNTKWDSFKNVDHQMTYSDYAENNSGFSHYYAHWVESGVNVKFVIANDYSMCITDTLIEDYGTTIANISNIGALNSASANIRFMWNQATNKVSRAYIGGSSNISDRFLVLEGDAKMFDENGRPLTDEGGGKISGLNDNEINLVDDQNFVYEREIKVQTKARAKLTAKYNNNIQYFIGGADETVELLGGTESETKNKMRIVYDFKTNRLVTAYVPEGDITEALAINADIMLVREHQEAGQQLVFKGDGALSKVKTVYGVMRFNRYTLNNKEKTGGHSPVADPKSAYERGLYWISFPFNVNLSDVFGFGTYGTHWIIMEYDGAARATEGYWSDSEGFWKYVMPSQRATFELKAGKGYVLALDLDLMKYNDESFWTNNIEQVELFFPSTAAVNNIQATNITTSVDSHECTIDRRTDKTSPDINKDRTRADSHWNMIGIPSYANYGEELKDGAEGDVITWHSSPYTNDLPFLYEWSTVDNTYSVQSGTTYPFKAMHAYMVQYHGDLYWSLASATPVSPIVARRTYAEKPQNVEMRIELQQNEKAVDQTFVKLSNDENVSTNFAFDEDLCKEYNANKANIYTIVENYLPVAGNTMPMSDQTTVVPVGVKIAANGDYTFAIPEGTNGVGVTLIDNETGIRTSLSALDYTINLNAGTYNERFLLEISPIRPISTDLENTEYRIQNTDVRKVLIDNILYIVKDGVMYDARGSRVQ